MSRAAGTGYNIGEFLVTNFSMNNPSWAYIVVYFALIIGFSFFYVSIVFNTDEVAESIQKRGGYIPGVRPGKDTAEYLGKTSSHLNFFGGAFLALIAVFPYVITKINDTFGLITTTQGGRLDFLINGASLIIVVGVVLDLIRKVDADLKSFDYKRFH
jgi:preprotein translocase subunit SecY